LIHGEILLPSRNLSINNNPESMMATEPAEEPGPRPEDPPDETADVPEEDEEAEDADNANDAEDAPDA
jgi:hypothetical protein